MSTCSIKTKDGNIVEVLNEAGEPSKLYQAINKDFTDKGEALIEYDRIQKKLDKKYYPIKGFPKEWEAFKKPQPLQDFIDTLKSKKFYNDISNAQVILFNKFAKLRLDYPTTIEFVNDLKNKNGKGTTALYRPIVDTKTDKIVSAKILVNLNDYTMPSDLMQSVLHEIVHGLTKNKLIDDIQLYAKYEKTRLRIIKDYEKLGYDVEDEYGLTNVPELLSEVLSNPEFQKKLASITIEGRTWLSKIFDIIRESLYKWYGIDVPTNSLLSALVSNFNKDFVESNANYKKQDNSDSTELYRKDKNEVKAIAQKYNGQDNGFFSKNINATALRQELAKHGYNLKATSNGNGYFITKFNKMFNVFKQLSSSDSRPENKELEEKLASTLDKFGIKLEQLKENNSNFGIAGLLEKAIYLAHNRAIDTLPEEIAHFYVEALRLSNNPLYYSLYGDIVRFQIYQDVIQEYGEEYNHDDQKLREEAMAKAISKYVVANFEGTEIELKEAKRTRRWFDKVLDWFKSKADSMGFKEPGDLSKYLNIAANEILDGTANLNTTGSNRGQFYQKGKSTIQEEIIAKLLANNDKIRTVTATQDITFGKRVVKKGDSYKEVLNDKGEWEYSTRVSDLVNDAGFKYDNFRTVKKEEADNNKAKFGTKVHADLSSILQEELGTDEGLKTINSVNGESGFKVQLRPIVQAIIKQHGPDAKFLTEVNVLKTKNGKTVAGTIDLLVVNSDGTTNVYDYKTINELLDKSEGQLNSKFYKQKYFEQLTQYRGILSEGYGVTRFGEVRIIPIDVRFSDEVSTNPTAIVVGNNTLEKGGNAALSPMPMLEENTDNASINKYLNRLRDQLQKIKSGPAIKDKGIIIREFERAITKVLLSKDINDANEVIERDVLFYESVLDQIDRGEALTPEQINYVNEIHDFYANAYKQGFVAEGSLMQELAYMVSNQDNFKKINDAIGIVLNTMNIQQGKPNLPTKIVDYINQLSNFDNPIFQAFHEMLKKQWNKHEIKIRIGKERILSIMTQIQKETGKSGEDMYDDILQKDEKGKKTGKLIARKNKEWFKFYEANSRKLFVGVKDAPLNIPAYITKLKTTELGKLIKDIDGYQAELQSRVDSWLSSRISEPSEIEQRSYRDYQIDKLLGKNSIYFETPDKYLTPEYLKFIKNKPDSGLAKLYNEFIAVNNRAATECDANTKGNNLPFITRHFIDSFLNSPLDFRSYGSNMFDRLKTQDWETYETDSNGERVMKIPLRYDSASSNRTEQSYDLGRMLLMWQDSVESNIEMQEIEASTKLLKFALKQSEEIVVVDGKIHKVNGNIDVAKVSDTTLNHFNEYVNKYIYGEMMKDNDATWLGYNRNKVVKTIIQGFSAKTLFGSIFSGIANITGGMANVFGVAIRSGKFSIADVTRAIQGLTLAGATNRDDFIKSYALTNIFEIHLNKFESIQNKELSVSWINKNVTFDKVFFLQKIGDNGVQNVALLSYLQNVKLNKLENGNIEFIKAENKEESVFEQLKEINGKLTIDGLDLTNEQHSMEFFRLREKIRGTISEILGTTSEYDQFLAGNELKGAMMMQFRRWILPMYNSRFGRLKFNNNLEEYSEGKYLSTFSAIAKSFSKRNYSLIKDLTRLKDSTSFDELIKERYENAKELNPNLDYEEFKTMTIRNIRSVVVDAVMLGLIVGMKAVLGGYDDKDKNAGQRIAIRGLTRSASELSFWFSPSSFTDILKSPIPIIGLATEITNLLSNVTTGAWNILFDDEVGAKKHLDKAGEGAARLTIGLNTYYQFKKELDKD